MAERGHEVVQEVAFRAYRISLQTPPDPQVIVLCELKQIPAAAVGDWLTATVASELVDSSTNASLRLPDI